jgi:L(+)-tartrate dehydratase beta subunit
MAHYELTLPLGEASVRQLRVNDTVTLHGTLFGIRDASYIALFVRPAGARGYSHRPEC